MCFTVDTIIGGGGSLKIGIVSVNLYMAHTVSYAMLLLKSQLVSAFSEILAKD
jgi:hypothetical protein